MRFTNLLVTVAAAAFAAAQLEGVPECVVTCGTFAAEANGCAAFTDVACVCASAQFIIDAAACLQEQCEAADLAVGVALQQAQCASIEPAGTTGPPRPFPTETVDGSAEPSEPAEPTGEVDPVETSEPVEGPSSAAGSGSGSGSGAPRPTATGTTPQPSSGASALKVAFVPVAAAALAALAL
ncbi:hypothetical protein FA15DRAFT_760260 [Coprinopsis marcescibilis]|uniref:CFEM domain-containing protein n=1 Tax=Coprinopsis marcescibilis TaxID=230819 RepID=A0A5C3KGN3_COPMA|nr:hypothetical protein FA15DRAFT_760260 [Coprinopsis marcescibilis]